MKIELPELFRHSVNFLIIFGVSAPLLAAPATFFMPDDKVVLFATAILSIQIAVVVLVVREIRGSIVQLEDRASPSSIGNAALWATLRHRRFENIRIWAMNGGRFLKQMDAFDIKAECLKIIVPSEDSIKLLIRQINNYNSDGNIARIIDGKTESLELLEHLRQRGLIKSSEFQEIASFDLHFFALFDDRFALWGHYYPQKTRQASTGFENQCTIERFKPKLRHLCKQFDRIHSTLKSDN